MFHFSTLSLDFPSVNPQGYGSINLHQNNMYLDLLTKTNKSITGISKERLYEELLQYKNSLNALRKEISLLKSDNVKKSQEIAKKDKIIEDIVTEVDMNPLLVASKPNKAKETYLISSLKTQFKELKSTLEEKTQEYENLKKHIKNTKFKELTLEIQMLNEELAKLKSFYAVSLQQNQANEYINQEYSLLKQEFSNQKDLLVNQQEILRSLENDLKGKLDENFKLKEELDAKVSIIKRLDKQLKNQKVITNKVMQNKNENLVVENMKMNYEKQLICLNKEVNNFMSKAE